MEYLVVKHFVVSIKIVHLIIFYETHLLVALSKYNDNVKSNQYPWNPADDTMNTEKKILVTKDFDK